MKKRILLTAGVCLCLLALSSCGKQEMVWKDPAVGRAVGERLGIPADEIRPEDLKGIEEIVFVGNQCYLDEDVSVERRSLPEGGYGYLPGWASRTDLGSAPGELKSLADFAKFPDLQELSLYQMSFDSLDGVKELSECKELEKLTLAANANLEKLDGIAELKELSELVIYSVPVSDFSLLSKMENLTQLDLQDVPVENLDFLSEMKDLEVFYADQIPEVDFSVVEKLPKLEHYYIRTVGGTEAGSQES